MGRNPVWCHHRALSVHLGLFSAHYRRNLLACWVNIGNLRTAKYLANNFVRAVFFSRDVSWACHTKLGAVVSGITSFLSVITSQSRWFLMILLSVILFLSSGLYDGSSASTILSGLWALNEGHCGAVPSRKAVCLTAWSASWFTLICLTLALGVSLAVLHCQSLIPLPKRWPRQLVGAG